MFKSLLNVFVNFDIGCRSYSLADLTDTYLVNQIFVEHVTSAEFSINKAFNY